ncbi:MAG: hypothetical protein GY866_03455, partial [Proteobacteria bacterium]|nr:hypothetical protein [Pseudomonadota bacterium]
MISKSRIISRVLLLVFCFFSAGEAAAVSRPVGVEGVLQVEGWNLKNDGTINLDGQWEFYWNRLLSPDDFKGSVVPSKTGYIDVPGYWDGYEADGRKLTGVGYATFRLTIENVETDNLLAFDIPLMHTAYVLWVNGRIVSSNGRVGKTAENSRPQYLPKTPSLYVESGTLELVLQVSNFSHNNGGIWQTITLGTDRQIQLTSQKRTAFDLFLLGAIFIMSLYHFGLYVLRRKENSTLFFGLFCLIITFRISIHGSSILSVLFPDIDWELLVKLDYFTLYFGLVYFSAFIHSLCPAEFSKKILNLVVVVSVGFVFFTLLRPALVFTAYLVYFQAVMGLSILYVCYVLVRASLNKREGALVVFGGCIVIVLTFVNDVLYNHEIVHTADLIGSGLFIFIFSQSFVLSLRFSKAFTTVEILTAELELKVRERTAAIKDLLDHCGQGFFSFARDYVVQKYTSRAVRDFFGKPIEDEDALELMFEEDASQQKETLDVIFDNTAQLDLVEEILPSELNRKGRIYRVHYHWIPPGEQTDGRVMIVLTDITTQRTLEQQVKADEKQNRMIVKIALDRHGFLDFLNEINRCLDEIKRILKLLPGEIEAAALFRHFHTIKGGMASYTFDRVAEKAHDIESRLEDVRSGRERLTAERVRTIAGETEELESILQETLEGLRRILPKELLEASQQDFFRIPELKIADLEAALDTSAKKEPALEKAVRNLRKQPVRNVMKKYADDAEELAGKLGKQVSVILEGEETEINHQPFKPFFSSLVHLIRNSVDHGLETTDIRSMLGKPDDGVLKIGAAQDKG